MIGRGSLVGTTIVAAFVLGAAVGVLVLQPRGPVASLPGVSHDQARGSVSAQAATTPEGAERTGDPTRASPDGPPHQPVGPLPAPDPAAEADMPRGPMFPITGTEAELRERYGRSEPLWQLTRARAITERGVDDFVRRATAQRAAALRAHLGEIDYSSVSTYVEGIVGEYAERRFRILVDHVQRVTELESAGDAEAGKAQWLASFSAHQALRRKEAMALWNRLEELLPHEKIEAIDAPAWLPGNGIVQEDN